MEQIVLFGDRRDREIALLLKRCLAQRSAVCHITESECSTEGNGAPVLLLETESLQELQCPSAILILKKKARAGGLKRIADGVSVIVDAADTNTIAALGAHHPALQVYTCGFGHKNTVTFSSRDDEQAVVSLQRPIFRSDELICDPFEIPCEIGRGQEDYSILATVMALILTRRWNENKSKEFGKIYFSY